jgi:imidazoleglycerol-phosphate dehydratase
MPADEDYFCPDGDRIVARPAKPTGFPMLRAVPISSAVEGDYRVRQAKTTRKTAETDVAVTVNLDGRGASECVTGIGFFDHMLDQLARHSLIDIAARATGDLHIDDHHTVEDTGIALGQAIAEALGDKRGIRRYGHFSLAMDDAQVNCALDLSGRPYLVWNVPFPTAKIGTFDTELVREFFQALSTHAGITLHMDRVHGLNSHHIAEAAFKAAARALRMAVEPDARLGDALPSTKGKLGG